MALRGINLGGWLVAERWITPGLFEGIVGQGERSIGLERPDIAHERLTHHRNSFITEDDFRIIKRLGFDFVRLPIGYWLFRDDVDGFVSGVQHVDDAFSWAARTGLKIVLDLHGLPGSQNGQDHSGQTGKVRLYRRRNFNDALMFVETVTRRYGHEATLLAVELINEPRLGFCLSNLMRYYQRAFRIARANLLPDISIIMADGFQSRRVLAALERRKIDPTVVLDVHLYQLFSEQDIEMSMSEHIEKIDAEWRPLLRDLSSRRRVIIGEWSAALPIVEGRPQITAQEYDAYLRRQQQLFEQTSWAYCYWTYKAPGNGPWSFSDMFANLS